MSPAMKMIERPVRIGGASGGQTDRVAAIRNLARDPTMDAIVGDWMSENVMTIQGAGKVKSLEAANSNGALQSLQDRMKTAQYAGQFLNCFEPAIDDLAKNKIKLVVNAGGSDTELLAEVCKDLVKQKGYELNVAWVEGDDVTKAFKKLWDAGEPFHSLTDSRPLSEWGFEPVAAQCYLGSMGIAAALREGADIVICGRVADAAPCMGVAIWWHNWSDDQSDELAGALVAGHLIECSAFVTGGYYSGFKDLLRDKKHLGLGFPIAEVDHQGQCIITKERNTGGIVNADTVISQMLYEINGPLYYNSDVAAELEKIQVEDLGDDRVLVIGITGIPPPPTTRLGLTAYGGYQAEFHFTFVGLDMAEKCRWMEEQVRHALGEEQIKKFTKLLFHRHGTCPENPPTQELGTVDFRIFGQSQDQEIFSLTDPKGFNRRIMETVLQSVPGVSRSNDTRQASAKPYFEYYVTLIPLDACNHRTHCLFGKNKIIDIPPPSNTEPYQKNQRSYETPDPAKLSDFGETKLAPLGYVALGRSGDKASDINVGFFTRRDDEWHWLRTILTVDKIKELLGPADYSGNAIDRFEMPNLRAVHFLLHDHLDRGYNANSKLDTLGKNVCEYLRSKWVEVPIKFLDRGRV